jgi:hypothetical protein
MYPYQYFTISNDISLEEIKRQYRKLCFRYHPDTGGSIEEFREVDKEYRRALEEAGQREQEKENGSLYTLINAHIYNIDGVLGKLEIPENYRPALSYFVEKGVNDLGRMIKQKLQPKK